MMFICRSARRIISIASATWSTPSTAPMICRIMTVTPPMIRRRIDHREEVQHHDSDQDQEDRGCALRIGAVGQHDNERRDAVRRHDDRKRDTHRRSHLFRRERRRRRVRRLVLLEHDVQADEHENDASGEKHRGHRDAPAGDQLAASESADHGRAHGNQERPDRDLPHPRLVHLVRKVHEVADDLERPERHEEQREDLAVRDQREAVRGALHCRRPFARFCSSMSHPGRT